MPSVYSAEHFGDLIRFVLWTLSTLALSWAVFHSMPAMDFVRWYEKRFRSMPVEAQRIMWALQNNTHWSEEKIEAQREGRLQFVAVQALTDAEKDELRKRLNKMRPSKRYADRALYYLLECSFCQNFWCAILLWLLAGNSPTSVAEWIISALAYAVAAVVLDLSIKRYAMPDWTGKSMSERPKAGGGCPGCGS